MKSGISDNDQMITSAARFLRERQQKKVADWAVHNPHAEPGGWGFQTSIQIILIVMTQPQYSKPFRENFIPPHGNAD